MTYIGHVEKGVVVFEGEERPSDGTKVTVAIASTPNKAVGEALDRLAGQARDLPSDLAEKHDQYRRERRIA
ncbi:MAG: hypothetical protein FWD61_06505 [Phycisphaerales bacterium]|nr:hypothetical protein [Phycisphaerales bacterium]